MNKYKIVAAFILCTVVGTLSHEFGHIAVAKWLGYETSLHYASMNYFGGELLDTIDSVSLQLEEEVPGQDANLRDELRRLREEHRVNVILILLGGPAQTISVGLFGFIFLFFRRRRKDFNSYDWLAIFLVLFLSRMIFNPVVSLSRYLTGWSARPFSGDEYYVSIFLNIPTELIVIPLSVFAVTLCCVTVFYFLPVRYRSRFILWGGIGSVVGYVLWIELLGPILLP